LISNKFAYFWMDTNLRDPTDMERYRWPIHFFMGVAFWCPVCPGMPGNWWIFSGSLPIPATTARRRRRFSLLYAQDVA
jgi:hypothetical protein